MIKDSWIVGRRLLPLLALVLGTPAWAAPLCTARPGVLGNTLEDCIDSVDTGGTVLLEDGVHEVRGVDVRRAVTLKAINPGKAFVAYNGSLLVDLLGTGEPDLGSRWLLDDAYLFNILATAGEVRFEGLTFRPPVMPRTVGGPTILGRSVLATTPIKVVLDDVRMAAWDVDADGVDDPLRTWPGGLASGSDRTGGVLVLALDGAEVLLDGVKVDGLLGTQLDGAVVYAEDPSTHVHITGASSFQDGRATSGQVTVRAGAALRVDDDGLGGTPAFVGNQAGYGGAIFAEGSIVDIVSGSFRFNGIDRSRAVVETWGGHVYAEEGSKVTVSGGSFEGGQATYGGTLAAVQATVDIQGGTFVSGQARSGGHLAIVGASGDGTQLSLGGVRLNGGTATLNSDEVAYNLTQPESDQLHAWGGGVLVVEASLVATGTKFASNGTRGSTEAGGGLAAYRSGLELRDVDVTGNHARIGGGLWAWESGVAVTRGLVQGNGHRFDTEAGGGMALVQSSLSMESTDIKDNRAVFGGGAVSLTEGTVNVLGGSWTGNDAEKGGALGTLAAQVDLIDVSFADNSASVDGAHVAALTGFLDDAGTIGVWGTLDVERSTFERGTSLRGGAVTAWTDSTITRSTFKDNMAAGSDTPGGALYQAGGSLVVRGSLFQGNRAYRGGAIGTLWVGSTVIEDNEIFDNQATYGGGISLEGEGAQTLVRNHLCGNVALEAASALLSYGPDVSDTEDRVRIANNLFDGRDGVSFGQVAVRRRLFSVEHNDLVRGNGPALVIEGGEGKIAYNLAAYNRTGPLVLLSEDPSLDAYTNALWEPGGADLVVRLAPDGSPTAVSLNSDAAIIEPPHLRGALRQDLPVAQACGLALWHPRPDSPLLVKGWPTDGGQAHVGIFGGPDRFLLPWETDDDEDGMPQIFDCDDSDPGIQERLVQYVDGDGDGVGGTEPWPADDCTLVSGNALIPGDCDDDDPSVQQTCGDVLAFYGSRCDTLGSGALPGLGLVLVLVGLRRRRDPATGAPS